MDKISFQKWLCVGLAVSVIGYPSRAAENKVEDGDIALLKRVGKAFSEVARSAIPAVVFISVEKTVQIGGGSYGQMNDPYGFFGDDFFDRFLRGRGMNARPRQYLQEGQGSGFLISKDGYILTNNHVVGDADRIKVRLNDGRQMEAKRIGSDPRSEVAVIKIEGDNFPFLEMGDSSALDIGEWVIAVGNPFGLTETLTVGVVSAKGRSNIGLAEYEDFIQTDAAINPGNSGGPLLNIEGKAVGVNTAIASQSGGYMGIGFAIPINMARVIQEQLVKTGKVIRGFLGVMLNAKEIDEDMAESLGKKGIGGCLVAEVVPNSPAEKAGIQAQDVITEINGLNVKDNPAFRNMIALIPPGTEAVLTVIRQGKEKKIRVTIGMYPEDDPAVPVTTEEAFEIDILGLSVRDLTPALAKQLGYTVTQGVVVESVEPGSVAQRRGIQAGFLILSVNRQAVTSVAELRSVLAQTRKSNILLLQISDGRSMWFDTIRIR